MMDVSLRGSSISSESKVRRSSAEQHLCRALDSCNRVGRSYFKKNDARNERMTIRLASTVPVQGGGPLATSLTLTQTHD